MRRRSADPAVLDFQELDAIDATSDQTEGAGLYYFSDNRARQEDVLQRLSSGGAASTTVADAEPAPAVWWRRRRGMGVRPGELMRFHHKSVVKRSTWADPSAKYPPQNTAVGARKIMSFMLSGGQMIGAAHLFFPCATEAAPCPIAGSAIAPEEPLVWFGRTPAGFL
jgi:hypothetical protein